MPRPSHLILLCSALLLCVLTGCSGLRGGAKKSASASGSSSSPMSGKLRESPSTRNGQPAASVEAAAPAIAVSTAAAAGSGTPYRMRIGDPIVVFIRDHSGQMGKENSIEDIIDDEGKLNLPFIGRITAAGKTTSELEQEIENEYINVKKIYRNITVNIVIPQRYVFVTGEVKVSNKYPIVAGMTLTQAIANAGGPTDWADLRKVQLIRGTNTTINNVIELQKNPAQDIPLEAGDQINVPRSRF